MNCVEGVCSLAIRGAQLDREQIGKQLFRYHLPIALECRERQARGYMRAGVADGAIKPMLERPVHPAERRHRRPPLNLQFAPFIGRLAVANSHFRVYTCRNAARGRERRIVLRGACKSPRSRLQDSRRYLHKVRPPASKYAKTRGNAHFILRVRSSIITTLDGITLKSL